MSILDDGLSLLNSVAPTLATVILGPAGGLAVRALQEVLGLEQGASKDDALKAVANATPDQILAIKQADSAFVVKMRELDISVEDLAVKDRNSARVMQTAVHSKMPAFLAVMIILLFALEMSAVLFWQLPSDETSKVLLIKGFSLLELAFGSMLGFYYGTSASSARKDSVIAGK